MRFSPVVAQSDAPSPTGRRWRPPNFVYAKPDARRHSPPSVIPTQPPVSKSPSMSLLTPTNSVTCASPAESHGSSYPSTPFSGEAPESTFSEPPFSWSPSNDTPRSTPSQFQQSNMGKPHVGSDVEQERGESIGKIEIIHCAPLPKPPTPENPSAIKARAEPAELRRHELPPPSTARHHRHSVFSRSTASGRIIPIVIALFVALSLLVALSDLLIVQFEKIDAIIGAGEDVAHSYHTPNSKTQLDQHRRLLKSVSATPKQQPPYLFSRMRREVNMFFQYYRILTSATTTWSASFLLAALPPGVKNETQLFPKSPSVHLQVPTSVHLQSSNIASAPPPPHSGQVVSSKQFSEFTPISFPPAVNTTAKLAMTDQSQTPQNSFALSDNRRALSTQGQLPPRSQIFPRPSLTSEAAKPTGFVQHPLQPHAIITNELIQSVNQPPTHNGNSAQMNGNDGPLKGPQMHQRPLTPPPQTSLPGPATGSLPVAVVSHNIPASVVPPVQLHTQPPQGPHGVLHQAVSSLQLQSKPFNSMDVSRKSIPQTHTVASNGASLQPKTGVESPGSLYPGPGVVSIPDPLANPPVNVGQTVHETSPRSTEATGVILNNGVSALGPHQNTSMTPSVQGGPNAPFAGDHNINSIEVWHLPRGRSLCRIFNAGFTSNGKIVLPVWTLKHRDFLSAKCGFVDGIFGILSRAGKVEVDRKILGKELSAGYEIDPSHYDLDLFSPEIPRHHMPHFVSDIIRPLVATEVLMGTGRDTLPAFSLLEGARDSTLVQSSRNNNDLRPSLLVDPITERGTAGQWVRHLGGFFKHPQLKFATVPMERKEKLPSNNKVKLTLFRSIFLTSVKPYEPYGLFGTSGKNIVFAKNGISRDPPWRMTSMQERPCRITITALTRKGPRALLNLVKLEEMIKSRASAANLRADFSVVDFTEMTFEQQVRTMQETHILIATHGAGNANIIFMRPGAAFVEVFPFSYKAGPFDGFAKIFGLEYSTAMSAPQTNVFKTCMNEHEKNDVIKRMVFEQWDKAVEEHKINPWVHRLEFEKEFGEPGKSQGMTTRGCVRLQQLEFNVDAVSSVAISAGRSQCHLAQVSK